MSQRDAQSNPPGLPIPAPPSQGNTAGGATFPTDAIGGKPGAPNAIPKPIAGVVKGATPGAPAAPSAPYRNLRSGR